MHRFWDIQLLSILWPWNPGWGSLKVIENYTIQSGTHNFLLTFHSNHRPISHCFRDKQRFPSKIANFSNRRVLIAATDGFTHGIGYRRRGMKNQNDGATRRSKSFKIALAVLIQYGCVTDTQQATLPYQIPRLRIRCTGKKKYFDICTTVDVGLESRSPKVNQLDFKWPSPNHSTKE